MTWQALFIELQDWLLSLPWVAQGFMLVVFIGVLVGICGGLYCLCHIDDVHARLDKLERLVPNEPETDRRSAAP